MTTDAGDVVRRVRRQLGLTLAQLGERKGYSAAQVSRYERGISPLTDVDVLWRFATALGIAPADLGLSPRPPAGPGPGRVGETSPWARLPVSQVGRGQEQGEEEDRFKRRNVLAAGLVMTAAAATGIPLPVSAGEEQVPIETVLVGRLRDAMLGIGTPTDPVQASPAAELDKALAAFHACDYTALATRLPSAIRAGHALGPGAEQWLAGAYILATRMLVKLDEQQLGWMAADRARQYAEAHGDVMQSTEAARQLAVLARRAGWAREAMTLALTAAADPRLRGAGSDGAAQRGLLVQSAAYTAARGGDAQGMRDLTQEAAAIATTLRSTTRLRNHGGGFSSATVQLHLISAENSTGDPSRALTAARALVPQELPTAERRARYYTDVATACAAWGRRDECVQALLAAERVAPEETHARPAVKSMIQGLLVSGRTTGELRGLAARSGLKD
ncbi:helix-turn-helix domain-containing protein [Streptomyces xanthochromogenes]|uniref:helix-turn-helix domain-containing protein n=1 Tax=Streptomyces xanthochromogenes TaxID=67384 RepID=UPI003811519C